MIDKEPSMFSTGAGGSNPWAEQKLAELEARLRATELRCAAKLLRTNGFWVIKKPTADGIIMGFIRWASKL